MWNFKMKKYTKYILILIILVGMFSSAYKLRAQSTTDPVGICDFGDGITMQITQSTCSSDGGKFTGPYVLLAPLPCDPNSDGCDNGKLTTFNPVGDNKIGGYLNVMIRIFIGLSAVLAVVMIVIGGIEYMTSELISSKEAGKERIRGAIFGLLLALGAWTLLYQINPDILKSDVSSLQNVTVDVALGGESSQPFVPINSQVRSAGITCPGGNGNISTIATSFIGHTTYSQTARNTTNPDGTVNVDCSSFVDQVYSCAGLGSPGSTTAQIFGPGSGATPITPADLTSLRPGDLIGWTAGQHGQSQGHVLMYI
jgi:hypothetical protein